MRSIVKSDFLGLFAGGFLLGTLGLFAMHPVDTAQGFAHTFAGIVHQQR